MPQVPSVPDNKAPVSTRRGPLIPPEEKFWVRYSPHHEFPLSSATSFVLHLLGIGLLVLVAWMVWPTGDKSKQDLPDLDAVAMNVGNTDQKGSPEGGGGGGKRGNDLPEEQGDNKKPPSDGGTDKGKDLVLELPQGEPPVEIKSDKDGSRIISENVPGNLDELAKKVHQQLARRTKVQGTGSRGSGGGKDGGKDTGRDKGKGRGQREGSGTTAAKRAQRQLRWRLVFNQDGNGPDYRDKLKALGAIIVTGDYRLGPDGRPAVGPGGQVPLEYKLVRNYNKKSDRTIRRVEDIPGIFWIDDKTVTVEALARALGVRAPRLFACFFPEEVERELRTKEREKRPDVREEEIYETLFHVNLSDNAPGYKLYCDRVTLKRDR
jgi:hypothetical protein